MVLTKDSFVEPRPNTFVLSSSSSAAAAAAAAATDEHCPHLTTSTVDIKTLETQFLISTSLSSCTSTSSSFSSSTLLFIRRPKQRTFLFTLVFVFLGSYCLLPLVYRETTNYWSAVIYGDGRDHSSDGQSSLVLEGASADNDQWSNGRQYDVDSADESDFQLDIEHTSTATRRRIRFPRTKRRLPKCIIVGVRKCGTRALLEFLNIHPLIVKATQEVHFFDENYSLGLEWYRRRMPYSFADQITVEKSPSYFVTQHVPERIAAMNRNVRLLLIVREPVTRAVSDYAQIAANRVVKQQAAQTQTTSNITDIERERTRRSMRRWSSQQSFESLAVDQRTGQVNADYRAVQISVYADYLQPWLNVFPRQQIHVIDGDRLVVDPLAELRLIENFLGLEHRISADNFYFNRTKGFYCVRNDTSEKCLSSAKGRQHPSVPAHVVDKLKRFFSPHNDRFFQMIGRNFNWTSTNLTLCTSFNSSAMSTTTTNTAGTLMSPSNSTSASNQV